MVKKSLEKKEVPKEPKLRESWSPLKLCISLPVERKRDLLKKAWNNKWKKEKTQKPKEIEKIIKPNCLRVDIATTFLKSFSYRETKPAKNIVKTEKKET